MGDSKAMSVLVVGDGPLARALADLAEQATHRVTALFLDEPAVEAEAEQVEELESYVGDDVDLAIEAVIAEATEKWDVITELDRLLPPETPILIAALNASATEVASWCHHPERVVGFAALPPLDDTTIVEFIPALQSSESIEEVARAFWQSLDREPVEIADSVGGVLPRVVCNLINEAAFTLMERVATPEDIDRAMQLGTNYPRGPLAWADLIRAEQIVAILEALGNEFGLDQYRPAPLLRQHARAGRTFY
ncbi:MAG: 3-hydroxyacyl-CoA dehydrogenase family protein [Chloroflexota bacterium]|nr:3-hydroxyacyl-CoA dehydrogenase family protein [Chloroflexota bacterium]